jgi:hypothetical protein
MDSGVDKKDSYLENDASLAVHSLWKLKLSRRSFGNRCGAVCRIVLFDNRWTGRAGWRTVPAGLPTDQAEGQGGPSACLPGR